MKFIPAELSLPPRVLCLSSFFLIYFLEISGARAHAFGQRYDLPLPLNFYLSGAGAAVALSFLMMVLFFRTHNPKGYQAEPNLLDLGFFRSFLHPIVIRPLEFFSVSLFCLIIFGGLMGSQVSTKNIAPTMVWVIWWVGFSYFIALVGNLWPTINPWSIVFRWLYRFFQFWIKCKSPKPKFTYPVWLDLWPAILFFWLFAWLELVSEMAKSPSTLATLILIYSSMTWLGMAVFGEKVWLAKGEAFSFFFSLFGRFAPLERPKTENGADKSQQWNLRNYARGLITEVPCSFSKVVFVVLILSTLTFDGLKETPFWGEMLRWVVLIPTISSFLRELHYLGFDPRIVLETFLLGLFPIICTGIYFLFSWLGALVSGSRISPIDFSGLFVFSLVPIAIAYHLAHYFSYLLIAGQLVIPLSSDPLGMGWNLFGTSGSKVDISVIGAKSIWYITVFSIVIGHIFAVGVAHFTALRTFNSAKIVLRSQVPILFLMIAYTVLSLWILSQPIVGSPILNKLKAPSDDLSLAPFELKEFCVDLKLKQSLQVKFHSDQPIEFEIHYHDGLVTHFPVKRKVIKKYNGKFLAQAGQQYCLMWFNPNLMSKLKLRYKITRLNQ